MIPRDVRRVGSISVELLDGSRVVRSWTAQGEDVTVGSANRCTVTLGAPDALAHEHLRMRPHHGGIEVTAHKGCTFEVHGETCQRQVVASGAVLIAGGLSLRVTSTHSVLSAPTPGARSGQLTLEIRGPGRKRRWVRLRPGMSVVGSSVTDIRLPYAGVAARHARLCVQADGKVWLRACGDAPVWLNGRCVRDVLWRPEDRVRLGSIQLRLLSSSGEAQDAAGNQPTVQGDFVPSLAQQVESSPELVCRQREGLSAERSLGEGTDRGGEPWFSPVRMTVPVVPMTVEEEKGDVSPGDDSDFVLIPSEFLNFRDVCFDRDSMSVTDANEQREPGGAEADDDDSDHREVLRSGGNSGDPAPLGGGVEGTSTLDTRFGEHAGRLEAENQATDPASASFWSEAKIAPAQEGAFGRVAREAMPRVTRQLWEEVTAADEGVPPVTPEILSLMVDPVPTADLVPGGTLQARIWRVEDNTVQACTVVQRGRSYRSTAGDLRVSVSEDRVSLEVDGSVRAADGLALRRQGHAFLADFGAGGHAHLVGRTARYRVEAIRVASARVPADVSPVGMLSVAAFAGLSMGMMVAMGLVAMPESNGSHEWLAPPLLEAETSSSEPRRMLVVAYAGDAPKRPFVAASWPARQLSPARPETEQVIEKYRAHISKCYQDALSTTEDVQGDILVSWVVSSQGEVQGIRIEDDSVENADLVACVAGYLGRWSFPARLGGPMVVDHRFEFRMVRGDR